MPKVLILHSILFSIGNNFKFLPIQFFYCEVGLLMVGDFKRSSPKHDNKLQNAVSLSIFAMTYIVLTLTLIIIIVWIISAKDAN